MKSPIYSGPATSIPDQGLPIYTTSALDTTFGSSGAPVFRRDGDRVRIASIVSGTAAVNGTKMTVGMALPALVATLKAKMIAEGATPVATVRRIGVGARTSGGAKFIRSGGS